MSDPATYVIEALYRPGSETAEVDSLGAFAADGTFLWTPRTPGLSTLTVFTASDSSVATRNIAVRFDSIPALGIVIFLGAGILLFGGTTTMLRRSLES